MQTSSSSYLINNLKSLFDSELTRCYANLQFNHFMKTKEIILALSAAFLISIASPCQAKEEAPTADKTEQREKKKKEAPTDLQKSLRKLKYAQGRPNLKADYYIYLQSASWCPPCRKEMPIICEEYPKMKKANVELILISFDRSKSAAKDFPKKHNGKFPVTMKTDKNLDKLVGFTKASGIPHATILDKYGKVVANGHGALVQDWKKYTDKEPVKPEEKTKEEKS